ncbi:MAG TPA: iron-containing alcohol dehydrogenase, partial [Polyangiaceae bacterium]|nr:iron-containing alcohol dehydrogenase [Polyangiaceae bacterium]
MSAPPIALGIGALPGVLERLGSRRILVLTGPSERYLDRVRPALTGFELTVFSGARRHVPEAVLAEAERVLETSGADTIIALGGGSAIGLAKALCLAHELHFVAIPTTYAGSEQTTLFGITSNAGKKTGRDPRVRPDAVVHDLELTLGMPKVLTVQSLMNALAHPLGTLETSERSELALSAIATLYTAIDRLASDPDDRAAREAAQHGAALAAQALEAGKTGAHHRLAHALGGLFDLDHGGLHSVLLPHTVHELRGAHPELVRSVEARLAIDDLEAKLFDFLVRAGAPTSLKALGASFGKLDELLVQKDLAPRRLLSHAYHGRRPSLHVTLEDVGMRELAAVAGPTVADARAVVVALHGRSSTAESILARTLEITALDPTVAVIAPQAFDNEWYRGRNFEARTALGEALERSVHDVQAILDSVTRRVPAERVVLLGFSQGACLAIEVFTRRSERLGAVFAFSGAVIGEPNEDRPPGDAVEETPVLLGASEGDPWVKRADIDRTAALLATAGADVTLCPVPGDVHAIHET